MYVYIQLFYEGIITEREAKDSKSLSLHFCIPELKYVYLPNQLVPLFSWWVCDVNKRISCYELS